MLSTLQIWNNVLLLFCHVVRWSPQKLKARNASSAQTSTVSLDLLLDLNLFVFGQDLQLGQIAAKQHPHWRQIKLLYRRSQNVARLNIRKKCKSLGNGLQSSQHGCKLAFTPTRLMWPSFPLAQYLQRPWSSSWACARCSSQGTLYQRGIASS